MWYIFSWGFRGGSEGKVSAHNAGDPGLISGLRSPGEGNGNPLQYTCLKNSVDRGTWWATVHGVAKKSDVTERIHFLSFLLSLSPLPFTSLLFSAICKASSGNHFAFLHFFFGGIVLVISTCTMLQTSVYSSSGNLSTKSNSLHLFVTSTV